MTKFVGPPFRAKSPCPLFVVRGWLLRATVSEFMKIQAKLETCVINILVACAFATDNGPLTTDKRSLSVQRAEWAFFSET